ncbi:MAG: hypothetical protein HKO64_12410 [Xanthomonadales bacterium]|nr:hypothetical protein [Gammaproteobacteria bacterium]NNE06482.1 hypothetical protein [Xanthomonadales bacterium]NNL96417.1 hypothetical protein [Xanthomonadales bacterium]
MKSVVLLTIALFLISAPAPDAQDVAEITSNFIVPSQEPGLQASQQESDRTTVHRHVAAQTKKVEQQAKMNSDTAEQDLQSQQRQSKSEPPLES